MPRAFMVIPRLIEKQTDRLEMAERRSAKDTKDSPRARPTRRARLKAKKKVAS